MSFYNTTHETGSKLKKSWKDARNQDEVIQKLFDNYILLSPWLAYGILWKRNGKKEAYPITSVRRSFDTLMKRGYIIKTGDKRLAKHSGRHEYLYRKKP